MFNPSQISTTANPGERSAPLMHALQTTNEAATQAVRRLTTTLDQLAYFGAIEAWAKTNAAAINAGNAGANAQGAGAAVGSETAIG